jgi:two-component sensor histidine kinase
MLALQSLSMKNDTLKTAFKDMENRIHSMSLVHQKLYKSKNLSSINLKEYISELSNLLMKSYKMPSDRISQIFEIEDINVLIDIAIPCGLIINELVSNSLKYAFPGDRRGEIVIRVAGAGDETIEITVSDNGVGPREGFDFRNDGGVGMKTIFAIGEIQLGGKVRFESGNGLSCSIIIGNALYRARV